LKQKNKYITTFIKDSGIGIHSTENEENFWEILSSQISKR